VAIAAPFRSRHQNNHRLDAGTDITALLASDASIARRRPVPRLTLPMAAAVQGFPQNWRFYGRKTAAYRQIGNAFPPPVARAAGTRIRLAIQAAERISL
jgi:site-specific DNA-cytosine methylase